MLQLFLFFNLSGNGFHNERPTNYRDLWSIFLFHFVGLCNILLRIQNFPFTNLNTIELECSSNLFFYCQSINFINIFQLTIKNIMQRVIVWNLLLDLYDKFGLLVHKSWSKCDWIVALHNNPWIWFSLIIINRISSWIFAIFFEAIGCSDMVFPITFEYCLVSCLWSLHIYSYLHWSS